MDYQLVLQFPVRNDEEVERLIALEDDLIERLEDSADVDGHDSDGKLMNFFVTTGDAEESFDRIRSLLEDKGLIEAVVAAYRHVDEDDYTLLWPEDDKDRKFKFPD